MNAKDHIILTYLRQNARIRITRIANETGIPVSTVFDRLRFFEKAFIKKYSTLIDFSRLGYDVRAFISISIPIGERDRLRDYLIESKHINSIFKINNGFNFLIDSAFYSIQDLEEFIDDLESKFNISKKYIFYIIDELKREEFVGDGKIFMEGRRK